MITACPPTCFASEVHKLITSCCIPIQGCSLVLEIPGVSDSFWRYEFVFCCSLRLSSHFQICLSVSQISLNDGLIVGFILKHLSIISTNSRGSQSGLVWSSFKRSGMVGRTPSMAILCKIPTGFTSSYTRCCVINSSRIVP